MVAALQVPVEFFEVGRDKRSWHATIVPTPAAILKQIKKRGGLISRDIGLVWKEGDTGGQIVVGGFRAVGTFRLHVRPPRESA